MLAKGPPALDAVQPLGPRASPPPPRPQAYRIVEAHPLPMIDCSKCVKHVLFPRKSTQRRLNAFLHATKQPMRVVYMVGLLCAITFWTLEKTPGEWLSVVSSLLQVAPVVTIALSLYYDVVLLVLHTYEFWYLSLANWLSSGFAAVEFGDWRVAATFVNAVGFQIAILTDASSRAMTNMFMGSMLTAMTHTAFALCVAMRALHAMTPFPVFDHGRWSVESTDVIVNGFLTLVAIMLRNAYRRFVYLRSSVADRRLRCILYRTALRFEPCDTAFVPPRSLASSSVRVASSRSSQQQQASCSVVQIHLVPFSKRILATDVVWQRTAHSTTAFSKPLQRVIQLVVLVGSTLSVVTAAGYGGRTSVQRSLLASVAIACAFTSSILVLVHCNRVLLLHLLRSFDYLFIGVQLALAHIATAYLDRWDERVVGLAARWLYAATFVSYDALTPVMRDKLGLQPWLAAAVIVAQIAAQLLLVETLYRTGNPLQDRTLMHVTIGTKHLHVNAIPFVVGREVTLFLWWLRLVWRFLHVGSDGLVLVQGALEYEDARAVRRPRSIFRLRRLTRRVGPVAPARVPPVAN